MAVVIDASSPAIASGSGTASITTASFTPPAGAVLAAVSVMASGSPPVTSTLSDSLTGTWTSRFTQNSGAGCVQISTRLIGSSAAMTVSASYATQGDGGGRILAVYVFTGADGSSVGNSAGAAYSNASTMTKSLTTTATGSRVVGGFSGSETPSLAANTAWSPMSGTNPYNNNTDGGGGIINSSSTTGTPGAKTYGVTWSPVGVYGELGLLEIIPLTIQNISAADSSSPAANNAVVQANIAGADTGAGAESATIAVVIAAADTAAGADTVSKITIPAAEAASGDEANKVFTGGPIFAFGSDVAIAVETAPVVIHGAVDALTSIDLAQAGFNGPMPPGPRIVRIEAD